MNANTPATPETAAQPIQGRLTNLWYRYGSKCRACGSLHRQNDQVWYLKDKEKGDRICCAKPECVPPSDREFLKQQLESQGATGGTGASLDQVVNKMLPRVEEIVRVAVQPAKMKKMVAEIVEGMAPRKIRIEMPGGEAVEFEREHVLFPKLFQLLKLGENVWLGGPAGSGKTTAAIRIAKSLGMKYHIVTPCSDEFQLLGFRDANGTYQETEFYRWATSEEPAMLIVDEVDRFHPRAVVAMNAALANRKAVFATGLVEIPDTHCVVATANTWGSGAGASAYVAAAKQDGAFVDRFTGRLDWDYDVELERHINRKEGGDEKAFEKALKVRQNLRECGIKVIWGPRSTIALARRVASGMSLKEAFDVSALATLDQQQRSRALKGISLS